METAQSLPILPPSPVDQYCNFNIRKVANGYVVQTYSRNHSELTFIFTDIQTALNFIQENI